MMLKSLYSDFSEIIVVIVPAPAMSGKAIGKTVLLLFPDSDSRKSVIPKIISIPKKKIIKEPAIAKEEISTPNNFRIFSPNNKNAIMITPAIIEALNDSISRPLLFKSMIIGIEPKISITENKIRETDKIDFMSIILCFKKFRRKGREHFEFTKK